MSPGAVLTALFLFARAAGAAVVTPVTLSPSLPLGGLPSAVLGVSALAAPAPVLSAAPLPSLALPTARAFSFGSLFHRPAAPAAQPQVKAAETLRATVRRLEVSPSEGDATAERGAALTAAFDGADLDALESVPDPDAPVRPSRPGFKPHPTVPKAILPDGTAIRPDSWEGGFHGAEVTPEQIVAQHGFPARGTSEDWRLLEHSEEEHPEAKSAFRGTTDIVSSRDDTGAAYWADDGGYVYEIRGVPTWDLNSDLFGRVFRGGRYRGNLMSQEAENAVPAEIPLECIVRWGQVRSTSTGTPYVPESDWTPNPSFDPSICARFFGLR
ncbi:MAG: hypothetical protein A2X36_17595 [Elusimicrobia bacterium GWA2_69_24]|nr:MAG: hypothetical protein A2X36_17595 [Elusimicrobia bacterium GWA2_69_24]HBL15893.1 hypothetical protein [Elusimicrobiota bacterium]